VPGPGEQGTLHGRVLQDLFFIRSLSSRTRGVTDFPNTKKQAQSPRQNEKTEKYTQKKKQGKGTARDLSETDISNMSDREFKVMIIWILAGLEKSEDMSDTLNTE